MWRMCLEIRRCCCAESAEAAALGLATARETQHVSRRQAGGGKGVETAPAAAGTHGAGATPRCWLVSSALARSFPWSALAGARWFGAPRVPASELARALSWLGSARRREKRARGGGGGRRAAWRGASARRGQQPAVTARQRRRRRLFERAGACAALCGGARCAWRRAGGAARCGTRALRARSGWSLGPLRPLFWQTGRSARSTIQPCRTSSCARSSRRRPRRSC
jgi:hypothetical protein